MAEVESTIVPAQADQWIIDDDGRARQVIAWVVGGIDTTPVAVTADGWAGRGNRLYTSQDAAVLAAMERAELRRRPRGVNGRPVLR